MHSDLDPNIIRAAFNRAAHTYNQHDLLQKEIANRLLSRLDFIRIDPKVILDCGARSGYLSNQLKERFPKAKIISLDYAEALLQQNKASQQSIFKVCAWPLQIPLREQSVDLIISNLLLHWITDVPACLYEWKKLLQPDGLTLFSMLGVDTLAELHASFAAVSTKAHIHQFTDMHEVGDALLAQRWQDPVVDNEIITIHYQSVLQLINDLKKTGAHNARQDRNRGLMGKRLWQRMINYYEQWAADQGLSRIPATFEVIYGHAWQNMINPNYKDESSEFLFPITSLRG